MQKCHSTYIINTPTKYMYYLSTLSYTFRRLLCHLQGEPYRALKTTVTMFHYRPLAMLYASLQCYIKLYFYHFKPYV
jgi:hypothetical protein